jgi:hypothetical protein
MNIIIIYYNDYILFDLDTKVGLLQDIAYGRVIILKKGE